MVDMSKIVADILVLGETQESRVNDLKVKMQIILARGGTAVSSCGVNSRVGGRASGGVAIITTDIDLVLSPTHSTKSLALSALVGSKSGRFPTFLLTGVYRPGKNDGGSASVYHHLRKAKTISNTKGVRMVVMGDFNVRVGIEPRIGMHFSADNKTSAAAVTEEFVTAVEELGLVSHNGGKEDTPGCITSAYLATRGEEHNGDGGALVDYALVPKEWVCGMDYTITHFGLMVLRKWNMSLDHSHCPIGMTLLFPRAAAPHPPPFPSSPRGMSHRHFYPRYKDTTAWHKVMHTFLAQLEATPVDSDDPAEHYNALVDALDRARPPQPPEPAWGGVAPRRQQLPRDLVRALHEAKACKETEEAQAKKRRAERLIKAFTWKAREKLAANLEERRRDDPALYYSLLKQLGTKNNGLFSTGADGQTLVNEATALSFVEHLERVNASPLPLDAAARLDGSPYGRLLQHHDSPSLSRLITACEIYVILFPHCRKSARCCPATGIPIAASTCKTCIEHHRKIEKHDWSQYSELKSELKVGAQMNSTSASFSYVNGGYMRFMRNKDSEKRFDERMAVCNRLASLFQAIISKGTIPSEMIKQRIHAILKEQKGVEVPLEEWASLPGSYRYITINDCLLKILDLTLSARLNHWAVINSILCESQGAFLEGKNGLSHVNALTEAVRSILKEGKTAYVLFVDFKVAYDKVNPALIKEILLRQGVPQSLVDFYDYWRSNRKAAFSMGGKDRFIDIKNGLGQGTASSCFLFILFINSLTTHLNSLGLPAVTFKLRSGAVGASVLSLEYADDMSAVNTDTKVIQRILTETEKWAECFGMELNESPGKTEVVTLLSPEDVRTGKTWQTATSQGDVPRLRLGTGGDGYPVSMSDSYVYLGTKIDKQLGAPGGWGRVAGWIKKLASEYFNYNSVWYLSNCQSVMQTLGALIMSTTSHLLVNMLGQQGDFEVLDSAARTILRRIFKLSHTFPNLVLDGEAGHYPTSVKALYAQLRTVCSAYCSISKDLPASRILVVHLDNLLDCPTVRLDRPKKYKEGPLLLNFAETLYSLLCRSLTREDALLILREIRAMGRAGSLYQEDIRTYLEARVLVPVLRLKNQREYDRLVKSSIQHNLGTEQTWKLRKPTDRPFGSRRQQYLQGLLLKYDDPNPLEGKPVYYSLAAIGGYAMRGNLVAGSLAPIPACRSILAARAASVASDLPFSPVAACNESEEARREREGGTGVAVPEGKEVAMKYRAKQGAFCKCCKGCLADTWHIVNECKGIEVTAARREALASAGPAMVTLFYGIKAIADQHATQSNKFAATSMTIDENIHHLEEFARAAPSKWASGMGRFLAFRFLTAWPFSLGPVDEQRAQEAGVDCAQAMAAMFEATRLPQTLLRKLLSEWVVTAARGVNQLVKAWAVDCRRAPGEWSFVQNGTDLVAACGVAWLPAEGRDPGSASVRTDGSLDGVLAEEPEGGWWGPRRKEVAVP